MKTEVKKNEKPWGYELIFAHTDAYAGKILVINKGEELSLQYHERKQESIYVYKGKIRLMFENNRHILKSGDSFHIPPKTVHRMKALETSEIFEVSTPELEDVVRLKDHYGRM